MKLLSAVLLLSGSLFASCVSSGVLCPKLEHAPLSKLKAGIPPFVYAGKTTFYVEMRDGKAGEDCYGETSFHTDGTGVIILADNMDEWHTRETLHHEVSHIAANLRDDKRCKFKDEDSAVEHFSPGWIDILNDARNRKLVEFLVGNIP